MINPFDIIKLVEKLYYLKPGTLVGRRRTLIVSEARAIAMFLVRQLTSYSWPEIGDHFEKDHTSVIHNCKKIEKLLENGKQGHIKNVIITVYNEFDMGYVL